MKQQPVVVEVSSAEQANQLYFSGEWCKPHYSDKRDVYVMIRRDKKVSA